MVMQATVDYLVGGSNPDRAKRAAVPPAVVNPPGFESPTQNSALGCVTRVGCDNLVPPHCFESSDQKHLTPPQPPPPRQKSVIQF